LRRPRRSADADEPLASRDGCPAAEITGPPIFPFVSSEVETPLRQVSRPAERQKFILSGCCKQPAEGLDTNGS
jgi:hypothetical protein